MLRVRLHPLGFLGVFLLHQHLAGQGKQLGEAHGRVVKMRGGASGGTVASVLGIMETAGDPKVRRALGDPYGLNPAGAPRGKDRGDQAGPRKDAQNGHWTGPFVMAAINTRVVRRSNALLDFAYGKEFRYDEATDTGPGASGLATAAGLSAGVALFVAAAVTAPGRALLSRFLPAAGEGPSREQRERGCFRVEVRGVSTGGERVESVVAADSDPGYGATSMMLSESALCLAEDALPGGGGVLTTALSMGMALVDWLRKAGMTLRVS